MPKQLNGLRLAAVLVCALALAVSLAACAQQGQAPSSASAAAESSASVQAEASTSAQAEAVSSSQAEASSGAEAQAALYGSPWVASVFTGNLPEAAPEAADDLYLHYNYDFAASHQEDPYASPRYETQGELQAAVTKTIKDTSIESAELEQLRIFYNQAADIEAREAAGAEELKPYLKAVSETQSLSELEELLLSESFPFSPWIDTTVSAIDMKSNMSVAIMPHMLFTNEESDPIIYQDAPDETTQAAYDVMKSQPMNFVAGDLMLVSLAEDVEQGLEMATRMFELEKQYGKEDNPSQYLHAEYGAQAEAVKALSLDELEAACPNYPLRETLAKLGEGKTDSVIVMYPAWLSSFNSVWTEENFELLRAMTEVKVLRECADFIAPSFYTATRARMGTEDLDADESAYAACDRKETFTQLLAKTYVEQHLGDQVSSNLDKLTNELIDSYIELIGETSWLNEQSRENVIDKIDNMALNVLHPDGGYYDYSELRLTPSEEGGTLLGNYLALKAYNDAQEAKLVGQPARASATWLYARPTTQNCYYDAISNSMNIFPGYITSASYSESMSTEELLAGIGFTIGHEISHAFDYTGSQFNAFGEPTAVFTEEDAQAFVEKREALASYYASFEIMPGSHVDGTLKSAEATADLCGMQVILERARAIEGFDYEKLYGSFANSWAVVYAPAYMDILNIDAHPLNHQRVNVNSQMFEEFYATYGVREGNTMYLAPENRLALWGENSN